ncbi:hypothetical protein ACFWH4_06180 [Streptomyces sp. NPDC127091]|uniref:hypothetical protein n=1 Tax=Streptomyces sp. NPDC127091 TaxID=3347134 RepID=UPI003661C9EE
MPACHSASLPRQGGLRRADRHAGGVLTDTESALRTAWLTACDRTERELRALIGDRLDLPAGEPGVRAAVVRVLDEHIGAAVLAGTDLTEFEDVAALSRRHAHAIRTATGCAVGNPVAQERLAGTPSRGTPPSPRRRSTTPGRQRFFPQRAFTL